jgi:hypothetical protein
MRSLKIIVFRDTDKPYTMIISPKVLIGTAFSIVALFSLLSFSVMSNVMFVTSANSQQQQNPEVQGIFADNENREEIKPEDNAEESNPLNNDQDDPMAGDQEDPVEENNEALPAEEQSQEEPSAEDPVDNQQPAEEENTPEVNTASSVLEPLNLTTSEMEVAILNGVTVGNSSISVKAQVRKRLNRGVSSRGRFVAALLNNDGSLSETFPANIRSEGTEILNPEKGDSFRIRYSRDYDVRFNNIRPGNYSSIVLMIYDQENLELIWRDVVPVSN